MDIYMAKGDPLKCARYAADIGDDTDTMGRNGIQRLDMAFLPR